MPLSIFRPKVYKKISKYLIEILVIFIGVMMAFIADNWRENNQDREDFRKIMYEIEKDIRLDSIEMLDDKSRVIHQINCLDMFLDDSIWEAYTLENKAIKTCFESILFFDWPDYVLTGFNQLLTSKIVSSDYGDELMAYIYEYYQWTDYHYLRKNQAVADTYDLQQYFIDNGFPPLEDDALSENEIEAFNRLRKDPNFIAQLKYLQLNRKEELRIYENMQRKSNNLLAMFKGIHDIE